MLIFERIVNTLQLLSLNVLFLDLLEIAHDVNAVALAIASLESHGFNIARPVFTAFLFQPLVRVLFVHD